MKHAFDVYTAYMRELLNSMTQSAVIDLRIWNTYI
jgi:hypothetical protein